MTRPLFRFLTAGAILLSAFSSAGCNDQKTDQGDIPDITYALWGTAPEKTSKSTFEVHDRNGAVVKHLQAEVTPHIINDCTVTADIVFEAKDTATGKVESEKNITAVHMELADTLTFRSMILPEEAAFFQDPNTKPPFTPKKVIVTHIPGILAVCTDKQPCGGNPDPFFIFFNPSISGESLVEAFKRAKAKCPAPQ